MKILGVVTSFYPDINELEKNINSFLSEIEHLIIWENTPKENSQIYKLIEKLNSAKIEVRTTGQNEFLAVPFNLCARFAEENNFTHMLTMDQDSCFFENNLTRFIQHSNEYKDFDKVAIFAPVHFDSRSNNLKPISENKFSKLNYSMTSGNLLSLKCLKEVGAFLDNLFIDWVDEEICIRICKMQFHIVQINNIFMEHFVGNGSGSVRFFGKTKYYDDYAPIRFYYITRNLYILSKMYPAEAQRIKKRWKRQLIKTIKYDNHKKTLKIKYVIQGLYDYLNGVSGPYQRK